jgi:RNA polymerase sigma-70 factor (ECF subfamily)
MGSRAQPEQPQLADAGHIQLSLSDPHAFAALFERHSRSVHRYLLKRVGPESAEDLVGETFVTAFRSRHTYDLARADARPWLFGIATNHARHFWRSEDRRRSRSSAGLSNATAQDHSDEAITSAFFSSQTGTVAQALAQLDDGQLDVLLLVAGPGLTYEEVAEALEIPVGTVRSRMSRARHRLRELLGGSWRYLDEDPPTEENFVVVKGTQ